MKYRHGDIKVVMKQIVSWYDDGLNQGKKEDTMTPKC